MKVLVVIDMQNDFITGSLGTPEAAAVVPRVVERIRAWTGGPIYATQDTHSAGYLETQEGRALPVEHCIRDTEGWRLESSVRAALAESASRGGSVTYLTKAAFGSRDLAQMLADRQRTEPIEEIVLVGLCTDICVISNALVLKAFLPETPIAVDAACCAGVNPQSHREALRVMGMCQIGIRNDQQTE